jgi:hypothetical protein
MTEALFTGRVYALYAQVALLDAEDKNSYPQWQTGDEHAVVGSKGIVVATAPDLEIEVVVKKKEAIEPDGLLCTTGQIEVGKQGLIVGNIVSADFAHLPWPSGKATVDVYVNGLGEQATRVVFALS